MIDKWKNQMGCEINGFLSFNRNKSFLKNKKNHFVWPERVKN